jgi:hypothetical protein
VMDRTHLHDPKPMRRNRFGTPGSISDLVTECCIYIYLSIYIYTSTFISISYPYHVISICIRIKVYPIHLT